MAKRKNLYEALLEEINSGKYKPLDAFPSEASLMRRFKVSRGTVRRAKKKLVDAGLLCGRRGSGTRVLASAGDRVSIGVLVSGCRYTEIFRRIGKSVCAQAERDGIGVQFGDASCQDAEDAPELAFELARKIVGAGVSGAIVQPLEFVPDGEACNRRLMSFFEEAGVPVVLLDCGVAVSPGGRAYDKVGIDNFSAGRRVGAHLAKCGAGCVLCCASPFMPESVQNRFAGVREAVSSVHRLEAAPDDGARLMRALEEHPEVDAIVCQNDVYAVGVMASLRRMKVRVPRDVMVAGFDGLSLSTVSSPSLTTISQPVDDIAAEAYDRLRRRMEGADLPPIEINLAAPLVVQKSTAAKPGRRGRGDR